MIHLLDFWHILWLQTKDLYPLCVSKFFVCLLQTLTHLHHHHPRSNCQAITSPLQEDDVISFDRGVWLSLPINPAICLCYFIGDILVVTSLGHTHTHTHTAVICFWPCFWWPKFCFPQGLGSALPWLPVAQLSPASIFLLVFAPAALNHHFPDCQFPH